MPHTGAFRSRRRRSSSLLKLPTTWWPADDSRLAGDLLGPAVDAAAVDVGLAFSMGMTERPQRSRMPRAEVSVSHWVLRSPFLLCVGADPIGGRCRAARRDRRSRVGGNGVHIVCARRTLPGRSVGTHIAIKLTKGGGPEPVDELQRVYEAAQGDPENSSWIATRKPGKGFTPSPGSRLLAFAWMPNGKAWVLKARIEYRCGEMPDDPLARDVYGEITDQFRAYWRLRDVERPVSMSRTELPGKMPSGKSVAEAFAGHLSFAYWKPGIGPHRRAPGLPERDKRVFRRFRRQPAPAVPISGVDFSGAKEEAGRNRKLWVASWRPDQRLVSLECGGGDPGFGRRALAERIVRAGGLWVIDFPFGPPAAVARAAGWRTWQEYLAWCGDARGPTALRDELRATLAAKAVPWSTRRMIDLETSATWFPFFEQLYRQTITGARDVLSRLDSVERGQAVVPPFHGWYEPTSTRSVVVEGFPGWTLRGMGLCSSGYKGSSEDARDGRAAIVDALRERGVPIGDADCGRAVDDEEGDATDALVLLWAASCGLRRGRGDWIGTGGRGSNGLGIEGWYID